MLRFCTQGGKASLDLQPHWVSSLAWPEEEEAGSLWGGGASRAAAGGSHGWDTGTSRSP